MGEIMFWPQFFQKVDSAIHRRNLYPVDNISIRETNCALSNGWNRNLSAADIFMYREGVENNNFDPTIAETKGKN